LTAGIARGLAGGARKTKTHDLPHDRLPGVKTSGGCYKNLLFVNKKKQKNFVNWSAPAVIGALQVAKVFCFFFSKKMLLPFLMGAIIPNG